MKLMIVTKIVVMGLIISFTLLLTCCNENKGRDTKGILVNESPEYVKEWVESIGTDGVFISQIYKENNTIIYLYVNFQNKLDSNKFKQYETINISSIKDKTIDISISYKDSNSHGYKLIEINCYEAIDYISLDGEVINLDNITLLE